MLRFIIRMIGLQNSPRAQSPHFCQVLAKFSADPTTKFCNLTKISTIFLAFCCYVTKSCWGTKEVLFELFPLNKFVSNVVAQGYLHEYLDINYSAKIDRTESGFWTRPLMKAV
jgi:hypothetical protein